MNAPRRSPLLAIFLTVFITMIGFGIVIPVLPVYGRLAPFSMDPRSIGWLVGIFSLIQLFSSPVFGKLSDRIGRKPVLIISIIGTAAGFCVMGAAQSVWMLFLGRIIDGISGGNIATAQACIADVTPREGRSKAMGVIGAAFGLGFIMGPALGGLLSQHSAALPFYFAGALSVLNLGFVLWALPETLPPERRAHPAEPAPIGEVFGGGLGAFIALLLAATLTTTTGFAFIHILFSLFCRDHFGWGLEKTSYCFAYVGVLAVLVQGGLLRRLLRRNIERELALTGAVLLALSLWLLPRAGTVESFLVVCGVMALGNGLLTPTLTGMASRHVHGRAQGRVLGLLAGAGSLGRFLGPALAVLPFPAEVAERPLDPASVHGYLTAFSWSAALVFLGALCLFALRVPRDVPEENAALPEPAL